MIKSIKINNLVFPVDYSLTQDELDVKFPFPEGAEENTTLGVCDFDLQRIYIAKNIGPKKKLRTLVHECIEAINESAELGLEHNHSKIVALENSILSLIVDNKELVNQIYKNLAGKEK